MTRQSITSFLDDFRRQAGEIAYVQRRGYRTERWSYGDLSACVIQTTRELEHKGIKKGDRVLLWGSNSAEWVASFFACALIGAIAVPMDQASAPSFAQRVCAQVNAHLAFCSRDHERDLPVVGRCGFRESG